MELSGVATSAFSISTSTTLIEKDITVTADGVLRIYYEDASTTEWYIDDISLKKMEQYQLLPINKLVMLLILL